MRCKNLCIANVGFVFSEVKKMADIHSSYKLHADGVHITLDDPTFVRAETVLVDLKWLIPLNDEFCIFPDFYIL